MRKTIKSMMLLLLAVGCVLLPGPAGAEKAETGTAAQKQKFNVVVLTPGTRQKHKVTGYDESGNRIVPAQPEAKYGGVPQLPNYGGETLTLGLLGK